MIVLVVVAVTLIVVVAIWRASATRSAPCRESPRTASSHVRILERPYDWETDE